MAEPLTPSEVVKLRGRGLFMLGQIISLMWEAAFWGIYLVVILFTVYALIQRDSRNRAWLAMLVIGLVLFLMSTLLFAGDLFMFLFQAKGVNLKIGQPMQMMLLFTRTIALVRYAMGWVYSLEFLMGDAIVLWRTWALWGRSRIIAIPAILWLASFVLAIAERSVFVTSGALSAAISAMGATQYNAVQSLTMSLYSLTAATNGVSTAMIAYKAWDYRQFIKQSIGRSTRSIVESAFTMLIESGSLYFIFMSVSIATVVPLDPGAALIALSTWALVLNQIVGLYPVIVIALVELHRSVHSSVNEAMSFNLAIDTSHSTPITHGESAPAGSAYSEELVLKEVETGSMV